MFAFWVGEKMQVVHTFLLIIIIIIDQFPLTPLNSTDITISIAASMHGTQHGAESTYQSLTPTWGSLHGTHLPLVPILSPHLFTLLAPLSKALFTQVLPKQIARPELFHCMMKSRFMIKLCLLRTGKINSVSRAAWPWEYWLLSSYKGLLPPLCCTSFQ